MYTDAEAVVEAMEYMRESATGTIAYTDLPIGPKRTLLTAMSEAQFSKEQMLEKIEEFEHSISRMKSEIETVDNQILAYKNAIQLIEDALKEQ